MKINQFTKEELTELHYWGEAYCFDSFISQENNKKLLSKIKSLIDNYQTPKETIKVRGVDRDITEFDHYMGSGVEE